MRSITTLFIIFSVLGSLNAQQPQDVREKIRAFEAERFRSQMPLLSKSPSFNQSQYDVNFYRLNLRVWPATQTLEGAVTIAGHSLVNGLSNIELDLFSNMTVDSVMQNGTPLSFTHNLDLLTIQFPLSLNQNDPFSFEVYYHGNPQSGGLGTWGWDFHAGIPIVWTLSEPFGAPAWWPCKDDPADKADSVFLDITIPNTLVAASNGLLTGITPGASGEHTYHWETRYPISTYLVSLAITNYAEFNDWYVSLIGDSMELKYYVYPEHLAAAQQDFSVTRFMIEAFAPLFGEYPFVQEKYGMAIFKWGGAMEHQTITSYGAGLVTGNHQYDFINAHELSHQWFGDCITMGTWANIWLNEGFASYAEALWAEHLNGAGGYHSYMASQDPGTFAGSVFVYDSTNVSALFSNTVYDKGSWVLHMLRGVLGDSTFFTGLKNYATSPAYAYGNARTSDFRAEMEAVSGMDLTWFFDEWVYGTGRPAYVYNWGTVGTTPPYTTTLSLNQLTSTLYKMPVQIRLIAPGLDTTFTVWDSLDSQLFQFVTDIQPQNLEVDPDNWILKNISQGSQYSVSGRIIDIADSSGVPNATLYWEGPIDSTSGAPLNFGQVNANNSGDWQLLLLEGVYAFIAFQDSFLQSEPAFVNVTSNISGITLVLTQPEPVISLDSLLVTLHENETFDTLLTIQNAGTGTVFNQLVEGRFGYGGTPRFTAPLLHRQIPLDQLRLRRPPDSRPQTDPSDEDWQHLFTDAQENPQNDYDVKDFLIKKDPLALQLKLTTHNQPTSFFNMRVNLFIDADNDTSTGLPLGGMSADYLILVGDFGAGYYGYVTKWNPINQNFDFIGFVDQFSANPPARSIQMGINYVTLGSPLKLNFFITAFNQTDLVNTIDYLPANNLGYLSASLYDIPWLTIQPLFDFANADSSAQFLLSVDPANQNGGLYYGGITIHATQTGPMLRQVIPIYLNYLTAIEDETPDLPKDFALLPNFPNPFNPVTTIRYQVPRQSEIEISIYNALGQVVDKIRPGLVLAGRYAVRWDAERLASGVYFYRIIARNPASKALQFSSIQKMLLVK